MTNRTKEAAINLRAQPRQRDLIDRAAALTSKSRTDFMLDASCEKAQEVLLDQRLFIVTEEQFDAFERAFDMPLSGNKGFQDLMSDKYSW
jgi:uncharacterized protein (DUF1778 family)